MRKVIAAINMTLDGVCDHTAGIPDEEIHEHYAGLLRNSGTILYGRITYELMKYWQTVLENPTGNKAMDEFAEVINNIPKIVFSHTIKNADAVAAGWESARLANRDIEEEVSDLKNSGNGDGKDILVGSRSLIIQLMKLNLIDEYQLCIYPVIAGHGLPLFENINDRTILTFIKTRTFNGGAVILYYGPPKSRK
jgi:dihydrofolate reductase